MRENKFGYQRSESVQKRDNTSATFSSLGNSIIGKPDLPLVVSNKRVFSNIGDIGPGNVGTDDWIRAKEKQDRV